MSASRVVRTRLVPAQQYPDLQADWCALERAADGTPFSSWCWVSTWLRLLPPAFRPLVFSTEDAHGIVALGLIVQVAESGARRLFGSHSLHLQETGKADLDEITIEYAGLLVRGGFEDEAYAALIRTLASELPVWRALHVSGSLRAARIAAALPPGFRAYANVEDFSYFVDLAGLRSAGKDYEHSLSKSTRSGLRRTERAYASKGELRLELADTSERALEWLDALGILHTRYWQAKGRPGSFGSAFFRAFHRELVASGTATGLTQLMRISAGTEVVGYLYHLVWNGWAYFYSSGLNYGLLEREDRPGYLAQMLAIRHYADAGMHAYDFMAGSSEYKRMMSTHMRPMHWIRISPDTWRLALERAATAMIRRSRLPAELAPTRSSDPTPLRS